MAKKKARGPRGGDKHQPGRGPDRKCGPRRKRRFRRRAEKPGVPRLFVPMGVRVKAPFARKGFREEWVELTYLYDKILYWLYDREDCCRAGEFRDRFEQLLKQHAADHEAIFGEECWSILFELDGDHHRAIQHREREIALIRRLREISKDSPLEVKDYVLRAYRVENLCDRLELLSILYHDSGNLDRAIVLLAESKRLCEFAGLPFEGEDLLQEYLDERAPEFARLIPRE